MFLSPHQEYTSRLTVVNVQEACEACEACEIVSTQKKRTEDNTMRCIIGANEKGGLDP